MSDKTLFMVVGAGIAAYLVVCMMQFSLWLYRKWRVSRGKKMLKAGKIPTNYSEAVAAAQTEDNADPRSKGTNPTLLRVRKQVGLIRFRGFLRGEVDRDNNVSFKHGVNACPHKRGSGEAKQWVRGYCQARNVMDPKKYMDRA